ncbi:MAG: hypothetical protein H6Q88_1389 [Anaeromyxobacteraceae bacterium]|jgi:hypothetical protein|nr:hypothetical protein [Anaeromyxobacteraceae bacterium]
MKRAVRLAVFAGLALAFAGLPGGTVAQEESETRQTEAAATETGECKPLDPCKDIEPGAASMEPPQALEDPATVEASEAHKRWVEEIWNSP